MNLYDSPERCKFRVEHVRQNAAERAIPLQYYEGIDDVYFYVFVFKLFTNAKQKVIALNWGQYNDASRLLPLFRSVLSGQIKSPTVEIVLEPEAVPDNFPSNSKRLTKHYKTEQDIFEALRQIFEGVHPPQPQTSKNDVFIPLDLLIIHPEEKGISSNSEIKFY